MCDTPLIAESFHHPPPHSRDIECAVLCAILDDPNAAMPEVLSLLTPTCFYYEAHEIIFHACVKLYKSGVPPDPITLIAYLRENRQLDNTGGESYIYQLLAAVPNGRYVVEHSLILREKYSLRLLIDICDEAICRAKSYDSVEAGEAQERLERKLTLLTQFQGRAESVVLSDAILEWLNTYEREEVTYSDGTTGIIHIPPQGLETGFPDWDRYLGSFGGGEYVLIAGVPGGGKSSFLLSLLTTWAMQNKPCLLFSAEMGRVALARRAMANLSGVPLSRLKAGRWNETEQALIQETTVNSAEWPLHIVDHGGLPPREIQSITREHIRRYNTQIVAVDYLQLLSLTGGDSKREALEEASRMMKQIATENNIVLLAISQLNKQGKRSNDPDNADLMGASLDNDPDWIIHLVKDGERDEATGAQPMQAIVKKNRDGAMGKAGLIFLTTHQRWESADTAPKAEPQALPKRRKAPQGRIDLDSQ